MIENKNRNKNEDASIAVAEESREQTWKSKSYMASIFVGDFDIDMAFPYPEQEEADRKIGDEICARVQAWCEENIDGEEIDRTETIPAHVWRGMKELGLFAIKIPKEYGGLGLSQTNYMRILGLISLHCGSTAATLSAHQSIGVPQPLKLAGTPEQKKKFLPRFAEGAVSAFALTEPNVGSDPANMGTVGTLSEDGTTWTLNGEKLWCTNGVVADLIIVMAKTGEKTTKSGRTINEISAFIVETNTPGFEVLHRCRFMGIRAIENGLLRFNDMKIPAENLIGGRGGGLRLALATLNDGRLSIPAVSAAATIELAKFCAQWGKSREQWGKKIGDHEAGADKLARISAGAYAMETLSDYCAFLSDEGKQDMRMEAAAAKMFNTELFWQITDEGLQFRGGRGYEQGSSLKERGENPFPLERALRDSRINRIVEGTTDVMHLFLAREALDWHLKNAGVLFGKASMGEKIKTVLKCAGIYSTWVPKLLVPSIFRSFSKFDSKLRPHLRAIDRRTKKLARTLFFQMIKQGPKLEMRQLILARIVDIGTELAVMGLVASRAHSAIKAGNTIDANRALYWLHARTIFVDGLFSDISRNSDAQARKLARQLVDNAELLPEVSSAHLEAQTEREFGMDLCNGKIPVRKREQETAPNNDGSAAAK